MHPRGPAHACRYSQPSGLPSSRASPSPMLNSLKIGEDKCCPSFFSFAENTLKIEPGCRVRSPSLGRKPVTASSTLWFAHTGHAPGLSHFPVHSRDCRPRRVVGGCSHVLVTEQGPQHSGCEQIRAPLVAESPRRSRPRLGLGCGPRATACPSQHPDPQNPAQSQPPVGGPPVSDEHGRPTQR